MALVGLSGLGASNRNGGIFDLNQSAAQPQFALLILREFSPEGLCMRAPSERDLRQSKLNMLIEGFMRDDWAGYRDALAWLRDFADQNIDQGRVMCGSYWYTPQEIELVRERARFRRSTD
jgi:hypothetical protein